MKKYHPLTMLLPLAAFALTGCVGPMACGPDACGPVAINSCGGCGDCSGCGELYMDPWINHPPDCIDPCDQCGNYNGDSCGKCRSVFAGWKSFWGYRCVDSCDDGGCQVPCSGGALGGGCGAESCCDSGCDGCGVGGFAGSEVLHGDVVMHAAPTPAAEISRVPGQGTVVEREYLEGSLPNDAYQPSRNRQIFRPKRNARR